MKTNKQTNKQTRRLKSATIKLLSLCFMVLLFSCEANQTTEKELTFEDIEKEFRFEKPLSEISRISILEKYNNLENYKNHVRVAISKSQKYISNRTLKASQGLRYKIYLYNQDYNLEVCETLCHDDQSILESAWEYGLDLPYSCNAGACSTCTGKCNGGEYNDEMNSFLDCDQREAGFCLLCITYPLSDCAFITHQESELY